MIKSHYFLITSGHQIVSFDQCNCFLIILSYSTISRSKLWNKTKQNIKDLFKHIKVISNIYMEEKALRVTEMVQNIQSEASESIKM